MQVVQKSHLSARRNSKASLMLIHKESQFHSRQTSYCHSHIASDELLCYTHHASHNHQLYCVLVSVVIVQRWLLDEALEEPEEVRAERRGQHRVSINQNSDVTHINNCYSTNAARTP